MYDEHVKDWRMAKAQAFLIYQLHYELRRFANMMVS